MSDLLAKLTKDDNVVPTSAKLWTLAICLSCGLVFGLLIGKDPLVRRMHTPRPAEHQEVGDTPESDPGADEAAPK